MNISTPFIRRPVMTTLVTLTVFLMGILAYRQLPVSDLPDVDYPTINIMTFYSGANSDSVANLITKPLEKELNGVSGVEEIRSRTMAGFSSISLKFGLSHDMGRARQDVQRAIDRSQLPHDLENRPVWMEKNPSDSPIMYLVASSPSMPLEDIYDYADRYIAQGLAAVPGIAQVEVWGSKRALFVKLDPEALAAHDLSMGEVQAVLQSANPHTPLGVLGGKTRTFFLTLSEQIEGVSQLESVIIRKKGEQLLLLKDIAQVEEGAKALFSNLMYRRGDKYLPSAVLPVRKQPGANVLETLNQVKALLPQLSSRLPGSMNIEISYDRSIFIDSAVKEVQETLVLAVLLVIAVIFISVGTAKETFIPAAAIPLSVLLTFIAMHLLGYSINVLTLLALTLAIGFVVDDAIVVMENILRYKEKGLAPFQAAIEGSKQVGFTIVAMTLSLIAVFIPLIFMEGMLGRLFREFSLTLAIAIFASGLVSLTLTPMLCRWMQIKQAEEGKGLKGLADRFQEWMLKGYRPLLRLALKFQKITLLLGVASLAFSVYMYHKVPVDFLPMEDTSFIQGWMAAEKGSSRNKTGSLLRSSMDELVNHPALESIVTGTPNVDGAFLFMKLKPHAERAPIQQVIKELEASVAHIPGKNLYLRPLPFLDLSVGDDEGQGSYQYELRGFKQDALFEGAEEMRAKMQASSSFTGVYVPLTRDKRELAFKVREEMLAQLEIRPQDVVQAVGLAYSKMQVGKILSDDNDIPIYMQLQSNYRKDLSALSQLFLRTPVTGQMVPLKELVDIEEVVRPSAIEHVDLFPSVLIQFNLAEGVSVDEALQELERLAQSSLPEGVSGALAGEGKVVEEYAQNMLYLVLAAIIAMYVVLGILYESFIHPLTILSTLPFAILGAFVTLYLFQQPLSLYGFIGMILLIGLVKKNGIMIVDYTLDNVRERKMPEKEAVYEACLVRFRPIMMTTAAAILGALPIAIGHGSFTVARSTLGLVIIGGLVFSQLLTLLFTPVMYLQFEKIRNLYRGR